MKILLITTFMMIHDTYRAGGPAIDTKMHRFETIVECKLAAKVFLSMPYGRKHLALHETKIARAAECVDLREGK